jgi:hypothetical protein
MTLTEKRSFCSHMMVELNLNPSEWVQHTTESLLVKTSFMNTTRNIFINIQKKKTKRARVSKAA